MIFKDLIPSSLYEKVDPNIKDAYGYNAEFGFRGNWKFLKWDVNAFLLKINNRFGTFALTDTAGNYYTYRTNIGNSLNKGIEMYIEGNWMLNNYISLTAFTSTAFMNDRYVDAKVKLNNTNVDVGGNKVESAPDLVTRNSIVLIIHKFSVGLLYSYASQTYADALNTVTPPISAATGLVPSYGLWDLNLSYRLSKTIEVKLSINNVGDKKYFTKRPMFYPGPGIWPSDGRSSFISVRFKL
jgi:Fe(3+) dicitrate transport protein